MHLITLLAFVVLFYKAETLSTSTVIGQDQVALTLVVVWIQPLILGLFGWLAAWRAKQLFLSPSTLPSAQLFHHRAILVLRALLLIGFGFSVLYTTWPEWVSLKHYHPLLQIISDIIQLMPFILGAVMLWVTTYPIEKHLKSEGPSWETDRKDQDHSMKLASYLDFNVRHQLLIVAVPMTLILFAANVTRSYDGLLRNTFGCVWASDAVLAVIAAFIFVLSPLLLKRIWRTTPMEDGPLRQRLEQHCLSIGLRCKDILIWKSDGMMINAAVMGVIAPVRYVLLSDALLTTMDTRQIEAVFGHEAGHVHHRHIQQFLMLAFIGWLMIAGVMELFAQSYTPARLNLQSSMLTIQAAGLIAGVLFWGVVFGWVSRRFERQADLFGAQCVTPQDGHCTQPCGVHQNSENTGDSRKRVCITGAEIFASALGRVAVLNGIPKEERSWRHSSIGSRMRFLMSLAGDANQIKKFNQTLRRIHIALWTGMILGVTGCVIFWWMVPQPALLKIQTGGL